MRTVNTAFNVATNLNHLAEVVEDTSILKAKDNYNNFQDRTKIN